MTTQFNYNALTLEELRTLASSPQVGAIESMPQAFRTLADKVGEVAETLSRTQADLPNWWKGPAAEQAAATLGRAAAEAREFHESALGAATAVSRCASVVAEQQHQMMNVPEVAEPGITDAIVRPATPMEALQAARQDAAYRAAHEQAVQVVNGIAAQYVETREHLASIGVLLGGGFQPAPSLPSRAPSTEITVGNPLNQAVFREPGPLYENRATTIDGTANRPDHLGDRHTEELIDSPEPLTSRRQVGFPRSQEPAYRIGDSLIRTSTPSTPQRHNFSSVGGLRSSTPDTQHSRVGGVAENVYVRGSSTDQSVSQAPALNEGEASKTLLASEGPNASHRDMLVSNEAGLESYATSRKNPLISKRNTSARNDGRVEQHSPPSDVYPSRDVEATLRPASVSSPDKSAASTLFPPCGNSGQIHRERADRSPRPPYLKEQKSVWLTDAIAAPADGIIALDWFD
jgi:hypothetical protein